MRQDGAFSARQTPGAPDVAGSSCCRQTSLKVSEFLGKETSWPVPFGSGAAGAHGQLQHGVGKRCLMQKSRESSFGVQGFGGAEQRLLGTEHNAVRWN